MPLLAHDWTGIDRVADVGGGTGSTLAALLSAHAHLSGVLVDLPAVAEAADATLRAAGVRERCEIVGADFFTDALPAADALRPLPRAPPRLGRRPRGGDPP
jgi:orsellinic acid C2-O-methyltransferase